MEKQELERLLTVGSMLRNDINRVFALIDEHREELRTIEITMGGGSMRPAIPKGSRIRIQLDHTGPYRAGQIIAFISKKRIMVHRIQYCANKNPYYLTCGDATHRPDSPVQLQSIVGPVVAIQQPNGWITPTDLVRSSVEIQLLSRILEINITATTWLTKIL